MKIKTDYIARPDRLVILLWIIMLTGACRNDDSYSVQQDDPVLVRLSVSTSDAGTPSAGNETGEIQSVYILQFNADGDTYGTLRYVAEGTKTGDGTYSATLLQSVSSSDNYKLVILANISGSGFLYGLYGKSYEEVQQACASEATADPLDFSTTPFPMFGVIEGGKSVQVSQGSVYSGNTKLVRAVARVDIGVGTPKKDTSGIITSWIKNKNAPFTLTQIQVWKAGQRYAYMPLAANYHWKTDGVSDTDIVIDKPSDVTGGGTTTKTYTGNAYITNSIYCLGKIYLPEADLLWGNVYDNNHTNRLAIIVGGRYNGGEETFYRVDFTNDNASDTKDRKMDILRNHIYQFTIKSVKAAGYATAELAYKSKPKNLSFDATLEEWAAGQTASVPSILGYYLTYQGFNGENVDWTYASSSSLQIPKKKRYWGTNENLPFNYDNFYKEGQNIYITDIDGGQNGRLYATVTDAFKFEGAFPELMVSGNDIVDESGGEIHPWRTVNGITTTLTAFDLCRDLEENGYEDWRLPRLSELALIYANHTKLEELRGFTPLSGTYWCGSEYLVENATNQQKLNSEWAWAVDFSGNTGYASWHQKTENLKIRCVRQTNNK